MPKVKRLPGGHFGAVVDGPPHPDGRRNQVRIQKRTRAEAQAALLAVQQERLARKQAIDRGPTLGEFCDDFAAFHFPQVADKTSVRYRGIIDVHITTDPIAAIRLRDLTPQDVRQWITRLRAKPGRTARTLSPLSVRHCVMLLRLILRTAVKWGQLDSNPASEVDLPTSRRDPTRLRSWQADEAQEFLDAMSTSTAPNALLWRATVGLALTTGIRRGELAGLKWNDIDPSGKSLRIVRSRLYPGLATTPPKTAGSGRTIPLSTQALGFIADLRRIQSSDRLLLGSAWLDTGFVVVLPDGNPPSPDSFTRRFRRDCAAIGVPYCSWHGLRHTFATLALAAGVPLHLVSSCLGHSDETTTLSTYAHLLPGATAEAMERAGEYIIGRAPRAELADL